jgi:hypothetical protein
MNIVQEALERFWPGSSEEALDALIWMTPYPFVSAERIVEELETAYAKYGSEIGAVIDGLMAEFDLAWDEHTARMGAHP